MLFITVQTYYTAYMNYNQLANKQTLEKTSKSLQEKGYTVVTVATREAALTAIKELIPAGAAVMNGSSTTLNQIGYQDYLASGTHSWVDLHAKVREENDAQKRAQLRLEGITAEYYLGSVHALTVTGDYLVASNSGSQLPHLAFTSPNLILVVSSKKIVLDLTMAMDRLEKHVIPLENDRMMDVYKMPTSLNKILISKGENPAMGRKVTFILVEEDLGF